MSAKLYSFFLLLFFVLSLAEAIIIAKPGCQDTCGNITIPYPFGIGSRCSINRWAELICDTTFAQPRLFFAHSIPYEVVELSEYFHNALVRVKNNISTSCSDRPGAIASSYDSFLGLRNTPFTLSHTGNVFTVIGCSVYGIISSASQSEDSVDFSGRCTPLCGKDNEVGCCQIPLPQGTRQFNIRLETSNISGITNTTTTHCGSAFFSDNFDVSDVKSSLKDSTVLLEYQLGNQTCNDAKLNPSSFLCKENSFCIDSYSDTGYYCQCSKGYEGYPYVDQGCQDVNECDNGYNTCAHKCINTPGSYHCVDKPFQMKWIILGAGLGLFLLGSGVWMYYRKRKELLKLSEKLAWLKGRLLLIQDISSHAKIFTARQLEQATNDYHQSRILGQGGYGTVYKGVLPDQSIVAVKRSKLIEKSQFDDFINEVAILTKIDHRNIVKLLGCSVETEHPLLVYEFVSNGTLSEHIFKKSGMPYSSMSWKTRLRIAAEVAGALAYLHSAASTPIIHRDVKSSNILLDDNFTAKVADFGLSRVNHLDQTEIGTLVRGTPGYLDPEYMQTSMLTEKSDVFSFGVVLAELLTGKKSISFERPEEERNLAIYFNASMNEERLLHIVEEGMVSQENIEEIEAVAVLVQRCLSCKGEERPPMKEVASRLEALTGFSKKRSSEKSNEEGTDCKQANIYPPCIYNYGASGSLPPELTMSEPVPR
ncbi:hypothetical protein ACHQM5_006343 [Ranunculus cassubicifolius]